MSHYCIRVDSNKRELICARLWKKGIDVKCLWSKPFSYVPENKYPNTNQIKSEIINLPLDFDLTVSDVDKISEKLIDCLNTTI
jgi:dTDP-4-amino-4,6-dideoxygalactose transaminase